MKQQTHLSQKIRIILIVVAALILCTLCVHISVLHTRLDDTRAEAQRSDSLVVTLKKSMHKLQIANDDLTQTLEAYDHDFSMPNPVPPRYLDVPLDKDLQDHIWSMCCAYSIEEYYELIYAVIYRESNFKSDASSGSSYGLMQINKVNHKRLSAKLGITDFFDPYQNVHAGIYMLSNLIHRYSTLDKALMAYNLGEGGAMKLWQQGTKSTGYSKAVLTTYKQYKKDI